MTRTPFRSVLAGLALAAAALVALTVPGEARAWHALSDIAWDDENTIVCRDGISVGLALEMDAAWPYRFLRMRFSNGSSNPPPPPSNRPAFLGDHLLAIRRTPVVVGASTWGYSGTFRITWPRLVPAGSFVGLYHRSAPPPPAQWVATLVLPVQNCLLPPAPKPPGPKTCDGLPATIVGTKNADTLTGTPGDDVIVGLGGDDAIDGKGGHDRICGGKGSDVVDGGAGHDALFAGPAFAGSNHDLVRGGSGNDALFGTDAVDDLRGGADNDIVKGAGGADTLSGEAGADIVEGGPGADTCATAETVVTCEG